MSWLATNLISVFLLPPLNLLLLGVAGWQLRPRHQSLGRSLIGVSLVGLWLLSTPLVAQSLIRLLETAPALSLPPQQEAQAIVILGGGTYFSAPEYGTDTVSHATLERIRYGAKLHRATGKPILVSGGNPLKAATTEAMQMKQVLTGEFAVPVRWLEESSNNTQENARLTQKTLAPEKVHTVYLVTHAWHMPRAKAAFERAGLAVIPAPTAYAGLPHRFSILSLLPRASALQTSNLFFHEVIGLLWYQIRG